MRSPRAIIHRSKGKDDPSSSFGGNRPRREAFGVAFNLSEEERKKDRRSFLGGVPWHLVVTGVVLLIGLLFIAALWIQDSVRLAPTSTSAPSSSRQQGVSDAASLNSNNNHQRPPRLTYTERLHHPTVVALSKNCTTVPSFTAPANPSFLPIWMPSYPASGAASASKKGDLLKPIIDKLTGWTAGSKNYHMSIRNKLKRCHAVGSNNPTAVCTNGHPLTSIGPQKQTNNFHRKVILVLRNFVTAHPAMMQDKAFAYHGATEQVSEQEWKSSRDEWARSSFATWKSFVMEWKSFREYYHIDLYVQYEKLMHPDTGVDVVRQLAAQLRDAGLSNLAPADHIPCIWYHAVQPEYQRLEHFFRYEPGYTIELQTFLMAEMETFIQEMKADGDDALVNILQEYLEEIRNDMRIDP